MGMVEVIYAVFIIVYLALFTLSGAATIDNETDRLLGVVNTRRLFIIKEEFILHHNNSFFFYCSDMRDFCSKT